MPTKAPLTDVILFAVSKLIDDSQTDTREPSHSDLEFQFKTVKLAAADPKTHGETVGKAKRVRSVLSWALENDLEAGEQLVAGLVSRVRSAGGFRAASANYCGENAIENLREAFREEGFELGADGVLQPTALESLSGSAMTDALKAYVRRAQRGISDAALVTGTGKDLLEATAAHVLVEKTGNYPQHSNFPMLLGHAFMALGFVTPAHAVQPNEPIQCRLERALYETACAVNALRNKQGTGHGRPWPTTVTDDEAKVAIELMGCIAEKMLAAL